MYFCYCVFILLLLFLIKINKVVNMDLKQKTKTINELKKIFNCKDYEDVSYKESEYKKYMTNDSVIMIVAKTETANEIIKNNFDVEEYIGASIGDNNISEYEHKGLYSTEFFKIALKLFNIFDSESCYITTAKQYPLIIENKYFKFILAPRVEN